MDLTLRLFCSLSLVFTKALTLPVDHHYECQFGKRKQKDF